MQKFVRKSSFSKLCRTQKQTIHLSFASRMLAEGRAFFWTFCMFLVVFQNAGCQLSFGLLFFSRWNQPNECINKYRLSLLTDGFFCPMSCSGSGSVSRWNKAASYFRTSGQCCANCFPSSGLRSCRSSRSCPFLLLWSFQPSCAAHHRQPHGRRWDLDALFCWKLMPADVLWISVSRCRDSATFVSYMCFSHHKKFFLGTWVWIVKFYPVTWMWSSRFALELRNHHFACCVSPQFFC